MGWNSVFGMAGNGRLDRNLAVGGAEHEVGRGIWLGDVEAQMLEDGVKVDLPELRIELGLEVPDEVPVGIGVALGPLLDDLSHRGMQFIEQSREVGVLLRGRDDGSKKGHAMLDFLELSQWEVTKLIP